MHTVLDGEMIVDEVENGKQKRRFLVYDIMMINGSPVSAAPFHVRLTLSFCLSVICIAQMGEKGFGEGGPMWMVDMLVRGSCHESAQRPCRPLHWSA